MCQGVRFGPSSLLCVLMVSTVAFGQSKTAHEDARAKHESILKNLSGQWALNYFEGARPGKLYSQKFEKDSGPAMIITFSENTVQSATTPGTGLSKSKPDSEMFRKGTTVSFGESDKQEMEIVGLNDNQEKATKKFLYSLDEDKLVLFLETGSPDKYPLSKELREGQEVGRVALHFVRQKLPAGALAPTDKTEADTKAKHETILKNLSGQWKLASFESAQEGNLYSHKFDDGADSRMVLAFSKNTVESTTKSGKGLSKVTPSSELFHKGSTISFGKNSQQEIEIVGLDDNQATCTRRLLYSLESDKLTLFLDWRSPDIYPGSKELAEGQKQGRTALHFIRQK